MTERFSVELADPERDRCRTPRRVFLEVVGRLADSGHESNPAVLLPLLGYRYGGGRVSGAFERRARAEGFTVTTTRTAEGLRLRFGRRP